MSSPSIPVADAPLSPLPVEDPSKCRLLGPTALIVQGLSECPGCEAPSADSPGVGVFIICSLVIKRQFEKRKRPWRIWVWDVSKQLVGQAVIHSLNLLISSLVAEAANNNPCSLYFLNVLIDTTIGVAIFYFALMGYTWICTVRLGLEGYVSGQYGNPPQPRLWWQQLIPYLASIITMKLLVLLPLTLPGISVSLIRSGHSLLNFLSTPVQVIFVMAIFPFVMNVIQFCLVDQVIKSGKELVKEEDDDDVEGYRRVPTREADIEAMPWGLSVGETRTRGSTVKSRSRSPAGLSTQITPRSPLFTPVDRCQGKRGNLRQDYGSTTPSSNTSLKEGSLEVYWSSLVERNPSADECGGSSLVATSTDSSVTGGEDMLRGRKGKRSGAPSPDSLRTVYRNADPAEEPSPVNADPPLTAFSTDSSMSDEMRRDARSSLSPTVSHPTPSLYEEEEEMKVREVKK